MRASRQIVALLLSFTVLVQFVPKATACGPERMQPIFVFQDSPDPPFLEFTQGKLGIVKPSFGRKTLTIAYRYLNGGSFNEEEQKGLVEALKGIGPEPDTDDAVKAWIAARKLVVKDASLPDVYHDKSYGSFDFFPNCTPNAFEVATETLKDRVGRYGDGDANVQEWVNGQDTVFHNCSSGPVLPAPVGAERPTWLRKDRDYQIAAAHFYSLKFEYARAAFRRIAEDAESDWQQTADYLVGRTMVREASLESDETIKRQQHEAAETYLTNLLGRTVKFRQATLRLLGLIKYRLRPEERVRELAHVLAEQSGNENMRQDLIDYVWLLDKFDKQAQDAEAERLKRLNPPPPEPFTRATQEQTEWQKNREQVERGELIQFWLHKINADGQANYSDSKSFEFKPEASKTEILQTVETVFGRKLSEAEIMQLWERHASALQWQKFKLSPNRRFNFRDGYEGCDYNCNDLTLDLVPLVLKMDELNDWIFTFQSGDPKAYQHALTKWRETQAEPWLVAALVKAERTSPSLKRLLVQAENVPPDAPRYLTVAYNRIRLLRDVGRAAEARQLSDYIINTKFDTVPVSAQNEFLEQRMELSASMSEFLKFAARKPVTFYEYGNMGHIADILNAEKEYREVEDGEEEHEERIELLKWDDRVIFDEKVADILNWHFPLAEFVTIAHHPALPDYLRQRLLFIAWTRAVLLKNDSVAQQTASDILRAGLDTSGVLNEYLKSDTPALREHAATFALLKLPFLSPYVAEGIPDGETGEDYYYELAWWCPLTETEYDDESNEVPKKVHTPAFLSPDLLSAATKERNQLKSIGNAKKYLGQRVIEWAKQRPQDPRVPEALFIAAMANQSYKYGCGGWEHDDELRQEAEALLREKYPTSLWALKLQELQQ